MNISKTYFPRNSKLRNSKHMSDCREFFGNLKLAGRISCLIFFSLADAYCMSME